LITLRHSLKTLTLLPSLKAVLETRCGCQNACAKNRKFPVSSSNSAENIFVPPYIKYRSYAF